MEQMLIAQERLDIKHFEGKIALLTLLPSWKSVESSEKLSFKYIVVYKMTYTLRL